MDNGEPTAMESKRASSLSKRWFKSLLSVIKLIWIASLRGDEEWIATLLENRKWKIDIEKSIGR